MNNVFIIFALSNMLLQAIKFIMDISGPTIYGPEVWGDWQRVLVYSNYIILLSFGIQNSINADLPRMEGCSVKIKYTRITSELFFCLLIMCMLCLDVIMYYFGVEFYAFIYSAAILLTGYVQAYYKGTRRFKKLAIFNVISAVALYLLFYLKLSSNVLYVVLSVFFSSMLAFSLTYKIRIEKISLDDFIITLKERVKSGFLLMLSGLAFTYIVSMDKQVLSFTGTSEELGYYSISTALFLMAIFPAMIVSQFYYPRIGSSIAHDNFAKEIQGQKKITYILVILTVAIIYIVVSKLAEINYLEMKRINGYYFWHLLSSVFISLSLVYSNMLIAMNEKKSYLYCQILLLITALFIIVLAREYKSGMDQLALSHMVVSLIYYLSIKLLAQKKYGKYQKQSNECFD